MVEKKINAHTPKINKSFYVFQAFVTLFFIFDSAKGVNYVKR